MEASHEQQLSLGSRENTMNITKGEMIESVIKPLQSPIPFSITNNSSIGEGGTSERAGCNVYACKTCNKAFTSFQALGGHRSGHKKARDDDQVQEFQFIINNKTISLKLNSINGMENTYAGNNNNTSPNNTNTTTANNNNTNNKAKAYGYSICGSKFTSGQGLGGHMTCHHAQVETATSFIPMALELEEEEPPRKKMNVFPLDLNLNLPAA